MKSLDSMTPDELFVEACKLRQQISDSAEKLGQIYGIMYTHVRRRPSDLSSAFVIIANAGRRFSGAVIQGAKRTGDMDKVLETKRKSVQLAHEKEAKRVAEAAQRREEAKAAAEAAQRWEERIPEMTPTTDVYGLFTSSNGDVLVDHMISQGTMSSDLNDLYGEE